MRISDWSSDVCSSDLDDHEQNLERAVDLEGQRLHRARIDEGPEGAGNADVEGADGKGRELRPEGADANDLGSDVHVASRHPGAPDATAHKVLGDQRRSEEHTSELQSLMRISYAVFCLKKKKQRLKKRL